MGGTSRAGMDPFLLPPRPLVPMVPLSKVSEKTDGVAKRTVRRETGHYSDLVLLCLPISSFTSLRAVACLKTVTLVHCMADIIQTGQWVGHSYYKKKEAPSMVNFVDSEDSAFHTQECQCNPRVNCFEWWQIKNGTFRRSDCGPSSPYI